MILEFACTITSFQEDMSLIYMDVLLLKYMIGTGLVIALLSHFILIATCIHRNSIWNLHATVLLIGTFLILLPSMMFLYIPYQHRLKNVRLSNFTKTSPRLVHGCGTFSSRTDATDANCNCFTERPDIFNNFGS